ncbi:MAG: hypothetical protein ABI239_06890 [Aquihabitans sp.]
MVSEDDTPSAAGTTAGLDADTESTPTEPVIRPYPGRVPSQAPAVVWGRRIGITALLLLAVFILVKGTQKAETGLDVIDRDPVIVTQSPLPGSIVLHQTELGVELALGYDGQLVVNGIEIPEGELLGAVDPATLTPEELAEFGVRPNGRNRIFFDPGPGKVIAELPQGTNNVTVNYHQDRQPGVGQGSVSWTFTVQ